MVLTAGSRFDRYEILGPLGAGGMGEVYLAQDTKLGRRVALKLLPEAFTRDEDRVRRFEQEARAASALNHPCILTVHDVGEIDGVHFAATEFVDGQTLRECLAAGGLKLRTALDVAIQAASALAAAHEAGIVHRDVKPENIMLRRDGYIKVLDFGLAKLSEPSEAASADEPTRMAALRTEPGTVMGTPHYMSPEQARGLKVDARTDIFSLGVVLYEMVAGQQPFRGPTTSDLLVAILDREPLPLAQLSPATPPELQRIVTKALEKDREERYQVVKDLHLDLKKVKQQLELDVERQRSTPSGGQPAASAISEATAALSMPTTGAAPAAPTGLGPPAASVSSGGARRGKRVFVLAAAVLLALAAAVVFSTRLGGKPILTDKDTILLADFVNTTGDAVFDETLKQGLAVQLQQSPFLNVFPEARVRQTLRLMDRSPDERATPEIAREICQRQGLKAYIAGSIAGLGSHYVIALEAVNGRSGETLARGQVEAESKEGVLRALSKAASKLRERLGESLASIQKFDAPLEITTSSLDALKAWSMGYAEATRGRSVAAIPFFKHAVELDPNFAYAYVGLAVAYGNSNQPALAKEHAAKAFALRDRVSELEKLRISFFYYSFVTGELDKGIEVLELYKRTYPRDERAPTNLSDSYARRGQVEKAVSAAAEAVRINPNRASGYTNLALAFTALNRFPEAKEVIERALQQKLEAPDFHSFLYAIAFVDGDTAAMKQQVEWASGQPEEYVALDWQTASAAFGGQWRRAQELSRRAIEMAVRSDAREVAAQYAAETALRAAAFGDCRQARAAAAGALGLERNQVSDSRAGLAAALCHDPTLAESLGQALAKQYPRDTVVNEIWLPTMRAALDLQGGNPRRALERLQPVVRYEAAAEFWPQWVRGQAHLRSRAGREAAAEFRKILEHRGQAPLSAVYPLAHLGLARAAALAGDAAGSRKAYQDFLALWREADAGLPLLVAARKEYAAVNPSP